MPHPHNAESILDITEVVLQEWNIPPAKLQAILTDNGSNMVKAFRQHFMDEDDMDEDTDIEDTLESTDYSEFVDDFEV